MIWFMACLLVLQRSAAHFTHQWAVHISGGPLIADQVALDHGFVNLGEIFDDYYHFAHPRVQKRSLREHTGLKTRLTADNRVKWAKQQRVKSRKKRDLTYLKSVYTDPRWPNMWYLNRGGGLDMNVLPAWQEGYIGKGAVVTILDDGLEKDHPDLLQNYDPEASYDVNNHDSDPSPRYDMIDSNRHGTRCAGEVAATSNNSICTLGVAYGAQIGGVRMLDGDVTDAVEARSLSLNPHHIDIYSASWGPDDDGRTVDGPGELAMRAFIEGVTKGRRGKGSIFVWASGNGGRDFDNCNCDGYTNSIYSLSISSATESGHVPWYSEACSSTLATTYSSGSGHEKQIVTTDLHHSCTISHTGTSASAPLAAGICALALQANPKLTWRDMQHIVVRTARSENLIANDWQVNGVGRNVSHSFGYGLMDAYAMVKLASKWKTVPEQRKCEIPAPHFDKVIVAQSVVVVKLLVTECPGVEVLEHVQAKLSISTQRRGDLKILLITPMGTKVTLLAHRVHDNSKNGFYQWPFMSVHSWGESPIGVWQLEIHNDGRMLARLTRWELLLYGTKKLPIEQQQSLKTTPSTTSTTTVSQPVSTKDEYNVKYLGVVNKKNQGLSTNNTATTLFGNNKLSSTFPDRPFPDDEPNHLELDYSDEQSAVAFSGCSKNRADLCLECENSTIYYNGTCVKKCPERYYAGSLEILDINLKRSSGNKTHGLVCLECHYSCLRCSGGLDYECTKCFEDAKLYIVNPNEAYCYPQYTLHLIRDTTLYYELCMLMVLILASSLFVLVAVFLLNRISCASRESRLHNNTNIRERDNNLHVNIIYSDSE